MNNETEILIIILIIIILIKYNELEEFLNIYQIDQEEENYNILPISLLHFRLTKSTFEWLCCEIIPLLKREIMGSNIVGLVWKQKIGASLWFLATEKCFRSIGDRFGMAEKITFPSTGHTAIEINEIINGFKRLRRIPNVIGTIDDSHI
ncbi:hypothetical protein C1646_775748 [Rhizophagus diaphanus]|nr:hypothetical protein C1646_775748 [Rhizophagus diaphanus] [Rhizophagus sp. MUCL 43196]